VTPLRASHPAKLAAGSATANVVVMAQITKLRDSKSKVPSYVDQMAAQICDSGSMCPES
jgi:hypothetical protein